MNKILYALLATAVGIGTAAAQQKVMKIEYKDGTEELRNVSEVSKISFINEGQIDPETKMVDLGLSVKWASYNVGATNPWEEGNFYAYGEVEPKSEYTLENYKWYYDWEGEDHDQWEEYLKLGATITGTNYDVAHVKWGDQWRMPTRDEWRELINNCDFTWTGMNGVTGAMVTSRINGNSIFLPACGMQGYKGAPRGSYQTGYYMTGNANVNTDKSGNKMTSTAVTLRFSRGAGNKLNAPQVTFSSKAGGIQVRPVHD